MNVKVRKFGNSLGIVLPRDVIGRLKTGDGQSVFLTDAPDGSYRLSPYDPTFEEKMNKAEDIIGRYRNTLKALAE
jgi:putative addiction module antidote